MILKGKFIFNIWSLTIVLWPSQKLILHAVTFVFLPTAVKESDINSFSIVNTKHRQTNFKCSRRLEAAEVAAVVFCISSYISKNMEKKKKG